MDSTPGSDPEDLPTSPPPAIQSQSPADQSEIEGYLNKYQFASEPSYFTRPNRYHGPASTWRSWTANDRLVAESLDLIRASDLSIHLYNAFDLKRRSGSASHARHHETKTRTKDRIGSDNDQQAIDQDFIPPELWTAWPLRAQDVPRTSAPDDDENDSHIKKQKIKPSANLEDALLATTLRHARRRWEARKSEPKHPQVGPASHRLKNEYGSRKEEPEHSATADGAQHDPASPRSPSRGNMPNTETDSNASDAALEDEKLPEGVQFFSSQAFAAADSSSSSDDEIPTTNSEDEYPVFSADDDAAYELLRPSIRHLLANLDDLLDGLHKARAAYALRGNDASSRSRSRSVYSDAEMMEDERFVRSGSRAAVRKRDRKRKRSSHSSDTGKQSTSRGRSTVRVSDKKNQAYGLRDWSDILGMATLTGWNIETVARASERCARLFGQNMTFRTFHRGPVDGNAASQETPWFEEEVAYASTVNEDDTRIPTQAPSSRSQVKVRHSIDYVRTSSRCPRCQQHKIRCYPIEPTSALDSTQPVPCAACSSTPNLETPCPGIMIRPRFKSTPKTCPYPDCPRHDPTKPFQKQYHLQRHLTDIHGHIYSPPTSPITNNLTHDDRFHSTTEDQIRPSAALTCPVTNCPRSTRVYKRSTRLYDHIRKAHPEFDVVSFKKIVARGGGRGRYDRSRSRSRGQAVVRDDDDDDSDVVDSVEKSEEEEESENEKGQPRDSGDGIVGELDD